jgi:hypothetical protein
MCEIAFNILYKTGKLERKQTLFFSQIAILNFKNLFLVSLQVKSQQHHLDEDSSDLLNSDIRQTNSVIRYCISAYIFFYKFTEKMTCNENTQQFVLKHKTTFIRVIIVHKFAFPV